MSNTSLSLILSLLWIAWAVFLFGGMIGIVDGERTHRMPRWTRMASSFVLVLAAWGYVTLYREQMYADVAVLMAVGMMLCFIGDLFMAELIVHGDRHILGGIGAFGLGHMAYIAGFLKLLTYGRVLLGSTFDPMNPRTPTMPEPMFKGLVLVGCWLLATFIWYRVIYRTAEKRSVLHVAALPYGLLLATTVGMALNVTLYAWDVYRAWNGKPAALSNLVWAAVPALGAILFFISDFILAARLFNKAYFPMIDDWVWLTYGPGQMLIVFGVGLLLGR